MGGAAQDYDPACLGQPVEKTGHEHEMADMVGEELQLIAVRLLQFRQSHDPGIGDNDIERQAHRLNRRHTASYRGGVGKLACDAGRLTATDRRGRVRLFLGPRRADDMGAARRQHSHRLKTET